MAVGEPLPALPRCGSGLDNEVPDGDGGGRLATQTRTSTTNSTLTDAMYPVVDTPAATAPLTDGTGLGVRENRPCRLQVEHGDGAFAAGLARTLPAVSMAARTSPQPLPVTADLRPTEVCPSTDLPATSLGRIRSSSSAASAEPQRDIYRQRRHEADTGSIGVGYGDHGRGCTSAAKSDRQHHRCHPLRRSTTRPLLRDGSRLLTATSSSRSRAPGWWSRRAAIRDCAVVVILAAGSVGTGRDSGGYPMAPPTASVVVVPLGQIPADYRHERAARLNGILVIKGPRSETRSRTFCRRSTFAVTASAPLASKIMSTLAKSPRAIATASGPVSAVPPSWRWLSFAGIQLAVPSSWPVTRWNIYIVGAGTTPTAALIQEGRTILDTDKKLDIPLCPVAPTMSRPVARAVDGITINRGLRSVGTPSHQCWSLGGLSACDVPAFAYSVLVLSVNVPGARQAGHRVHRPRRQRRNG